VIGKSLIKILDFYLYSSVHVAVSVAFFILQTYLLLNIKIDTHYIVFIFSSTIFLYSLHNVLGLYIHENKIFRDKLSIINKMKYPLFFLIVLSGIGSSFCFFHLTLMEIASLAAFAFISIWYVLPIFGNRKRLSDYPIIKIFMVSLVWAAIAVLIPLVETNINLTTKALIFIEKFMFIFALVIPFDIRDIEFDNSRSVKTIPILLGKRKSIILALFAISISITIALYLYSIKIYASNLIIPIILGYLFSSIIVALSENKSKDYYFTGFVDGLPIINYLFILTISRI